MVVLLVGVLFAGLATPVVGVLPDVDSVVWNYPSVWEGWDGVPKTVSVSGDALAWSNVIDHTGYDSRAYTAQSSLMYNGFSTKDHVVFDGDTLRFLGMMLVRLWIWCLLMCMLVGLILCRFL
jgi:hypothetical protein